ncbi:hypothetical protein [Thermanaerovibrio acidaminovorans]|uniref:Uncharacterized protein n=1 Tax=Thermanaerovibrio acidaminovorans (strain ATCC 49978 / DSM 6589 / Su883) TaxID=525903 RepID=D1B9Y2_THEAS|nr:hypothetical protein [Thermanaerovibrio acidaminovorans]ACZ19085.1 hypothetical protein Taci_0852 [Thermanaerovibrio acidaminovorans DSM 6589]
MSENLAQEIRQCEEAAQRMLADARAEASRLVAEAKAESSRSVKESWQRFYREHRDRIAKAEREADLAAQGLLEKGRREAEAYFESRKGSVQAVVSWVVEEVMRSHGLG